MGGNIFYFWGQHRPGSTGGEAWPTLAPHYITANHKINIQHSFMVCKIFQYDAFQLNVIYIQYFNLTGEKSAHI